MIIGGGPHAASGIIFRSQSTDKSQLCRTVWFHNVASLLERRVAVQPGCLSPPLTCAGCTALSLTHRPALNAGISQIRSSQQVIYKAVVLPLYQPLCVCECVLTDLKVL